MLNLHLNNSVIQRLSANELSILEYIYENHEDVVHMSIRELSQAVSYSSATILRFCKKLGLSGFSELKFALRNEAEDPKQKTENIPILSNQSIIDTIETEVTGTANLIKNDHFREIIALLASDLPIYLWSPGGITSILIDYMEKLLFVFGRQKVYRLVSERLAKHTFHNLPSKAIFFVISTSGLHEPTVRLARLASVNGMYLIAITPFNNNTIAQLTPYNLHFFTNQRENEGADITSRIPIFYILAMLIRYYSAYQKGENL